MILINKRKNIVLIDSAQVQQIEFADIAFQIRFIQGDSYNFNNEEEILSPNRYLKNTEHKTVYSNIQEVLRSTRPEERPRLENLLTQLYDGYKKESN